MEGVTETGNTSVVTAEKPASEVQKQQRWEEIKKEFTTVSDKLGQEIDPGILDTVVGLNVLGVNTFQSCEGHSDHATGAPYIDIEAKRTPELEMLETQATTAYRQADEAFRGLPPSQETPEEIKQLLIQARQLQAEASKPQLQERQKAMNYLDEFYRDRQVPYDRRLIIVPLFQFGESRIESQGAGLQSIASPDVKQQKLLEYQAAMKEFANFLKGKYFSTPPSS
jgi:hypothetical protein